MDLALFRGVVSIKFSRCDIGLGFTSKWYQVVPDTSYMSIRFLITFVMFCIDLYRLFFLIVYAKGVVQGFPSSTVLSQMLGASEHQIGKL